MTKWDSFQLVYLLEELVSHQRPQLDLIPLKAFPGAMTCSFFFPSDSVLLSHPSQGATQVQLHLVWLILLGVIFFFPLCFSVHGLCEFLKLFLFFPSLFGVESSYFSYSDSSPLLSHVEMSSQLSFLDVCFFAIVLCILGHTRSQWESTFLHKLLEFLYQLETSKVKIFFPIVTH